MDNKEINDIRKQKIYLRNEIAQRKRMLSLEEKQYRSNQILTNVENLIFFKKSRNILFYSSLPDEVETNHKIDEWSATKSVYLPVVCGDDLKLRLYNKNNLKKGAYGILEPTGDDLEELSTIDLVIVPGVAFDKTCNRIGRGKGYYDRLLKNIDVPKVGICFDFQIIETVPTEIFDEPLTAVVCESWIFTSNDNAELSLPTQIV